MTKTTREILEATLITTALVTVWYCPLVLFVVAVGFAAYRVALATDK